LDPDRDFQVDYSFPTHTELANAVKSGIAELGVISEPLVSLSAEANSEVKSIIDFNREWDQMHRDTIPFAQTALLVKKSLAESAPELVMEYLNKVRSSIEKVNAYPEEAARLIVSHGILPDTLVALRSIPGSHLGFSYAWDIRKGINDYFRIFYNFNPLILGNKLPDEGFYFKKTQE
jgi:NitT/TauT family transport system substrate-binding protein